MRYRLINDKEFYLDLEAIRRSLPGEVKGCGSFNRTLNI